MKISWILLSSLLISNCLYASEARLLEVNLTELCSKEIPSTEVPFECKTNETSLDQLILNMEDILHPTPALCEELKNINEDFEVPVELPGDPPGKRTIIRFTMGLKTVPHDMKTNMHLTRPDGSTQTINNFVMKYDTRWQHFNPKNWTGIEEATNFFHESTMSYQIEVLFEGKNKKRTGLTLFFDHPKFKGAMAQKEDGSFESVKTIENKNFGDTSAYSPGDKIYHVQNSHMNLIGGIKISRDLYVKEFKDGSRLSYGLHAGAGLNVGAARSVEAQVAKPGEEGSWNAHVDTMKLQGYTAMVGHGIEYEKGRTAVGLSNTFQHSQIKQDYLGGGRVSYNLPQAAVSLTVSIDLFNSKINRERKARKVPD